MAIPNHSLLDSHIPISTKAQLMKSLFYWLTMLKIVKLTANILYKKDYPEERMTKILLAAYHMVQKARGTEHYWLNILVPGILEIMSSIAVYTLRPEGKKNFLLQLYLRLTKVTTILDKITQGKRRWRRTLKDMEKKLTKLSKQFPLYACHHPDELTNRRITNLIEILILTLNSLHQEEEEETTFSEEDGNTNPNIQQEATRQRLGTLDKHTKANSSTNSQGSLKQKPPVQKHTPQYTQRSKRNRRKRTCVY